ncbi:MAG: lanthionine synthetase LanC family protein [Nannocystaceae bacterium]
MSSRVHESLVLHPDTRFIPAAELPAGVQQELGCEPGDVAIGRRRSRARLRLVDDDAVELLRQFESPRPILEALVRYCIPRQLDPVDALQHAFPLLERMTRLRHLVPASEPTEAFEPTLSVGDEHDGWRVTQRIRVLEDSEVHQVEGPDGQLAALKLVPPGAPSSRARGLEREAAIVARLDLPSCPRLLAHGADAQGQFLRLQWCPGTDAATAASLRPWGAGPGSRLAVCIAIVRAFEHLHRCGVVHGDVHPGNIRVDEHGTVRLIDLGNARCDALGPEQAVGPGGGVEAFEAPERARAQLQERSVPPPTEASEQYSLGVLVYRLLTGRPHQHWSPRRRAMLEQIVERDPLPFAAVGAPSWPQLEAAVRRALAKDPAQRHPSVAAFAQALESAGRGSRPTAPVVPQEARATKLGAEVLARIRPGLSLGSTLAHRGLSEAPRSSLDFGAAGIAYWFLRLALVRQDPQALSLADLWITRAEQAMEHESAFYSAELPRERVGEASLYHAATGVHCVRALVSLALGDRGEAERARDRFVDVCTRPADAVDLVLGRPGLLRGAALLHEALGPDPDRPAPLDPGAARLRATGDRLLDELWDHLGDERVSDRRATKWLGIAHGWAGVLYASLAWCQTTGRPLPGAVRPRLLELAAAAESRDGAERWPRAVGSDSPTFWPGWCHGSAGHGLLWDLAHEVLGEAAYGRRADRAALHAWRHRERQSFGLCCGLAGQAYAMLNRYRRTSDPVWRDRAGVLATRAFEASVAGRLPPTSLYKGDIGIAVLAVELAQPERARMPMFEGDLA